MRLTDLIQTDGQTLELSDKDRQKEDKDREKGKCQRQTI